ncbi:hypothetical protein [Streptomyces pratensis]|uniref:hypothetical protein n=1 Tax=Streptomyces pratensis TaxID=1169025 RepID=UPI00301A8258
MTVDPSDPETFERTEPEAPGHEAPEADAAEQRTEVRPEDDEQDASVDPATANPADVAEQNRVVPLDEDDYR